MNNEEYLRRWEFVTFNAVRGEYLIQEDAPNLPVLQ